MIADLLEGFYLNELLVEPRKGIITGGIRSVHLPPKAMDVLLLLARRPEETVLRDELISAVWPNGGSSEALRHTISEIRHTLDDHADHPEYIETLPGRGYRLMVAPTATAKGAATTEPGGWLDRLKRRGVLETALAYIVSGWLVLQVMDVLSEPLHIPAWVGTFITVGIIAGFPIALLLSWFFEFRDGRAIRDKPGAARPPRKTFSRSYLSIVFAMGIAAVAVYVYDQKVGLPISDDAPVSAPEPSTALPPVQPNSIAVLPFLNLDGSSDTEIFSQGLVDDVTGRLARVPGLLVSARGDAFTLEPNTPSSRVRERLRVARYIEGSVQMRGEQMRVIVQLINSDTGFHELSRTFDKSREDFFDIRDELTDLTVASVRVALPPDTQAQTAISAADPGLDAYVRYRQGIDASRQPISGETIALALARFDEALELDPDYAAAHAGRCTVHVTAYPFTNETRYIDLAEQSCAQALGLNPNLDVVHAALGQLYAGTGRYDEAEAAFLRALDIHPGSVVSLTGLGIIYQLQSKDQQAEEMLRKAIGLHPGDWSAYNELGRFLYSSGRYEEAAEQYAVVIELEQENLYGYTNLGTAQMMSGDFQAAVRTFERAISIRPWALAYSNLGLMHYYLGEGSRAIEAHQSAVKLSPNDHLAWSNLGDALWIDGRQAQARMAFETARKLAEDAMDVNPNNPGFLMDLAWIDAMLDQPSQSRDAINRARSLAPNDPYVHYIDGLIRMKGNEVPAALDAFREAVEEGYSRKMLAADPQLVSLRDDDRFARITGRGNSR